MKVRIIAESETVYEMGDRMWKDMVKDARVTDSEGVTRVVGEKLEQSLRKYGSRVEEGLPGETKTHAQLNIVVAL